VALNVVIARSSETSFEKVSAEYTPVQQPIINPHARKTKRQPKPQAQPNNVSTPPFAPNTPAKTDNKVLSRDTPSGVDQICREPSKRRNFVKFQMYLKTLVDEQQQSNGLFLLQQNKLESAIQICSLRDKVIQLDAQGTVATDAIMQLINNAARFIREENARITEKMQEIANLKRELAQDCEKANSKSQIQELLARYDTLYHEYNNFLEETKKQVAFCQNLEEQGKKCLQ